MDFSIRRLLVSLTEKHIRQGSLGPVCPPGPTIPIRPAPSPAGNTSQEMGITATTDSIIEAGVTRTNNGRFAPRAPAYRYTQAQRRPMVAIRVFRPENTILCLEF